MLPTEATLPHNGTHRLKTDIWRPTRPPECLTPDAAVAPALASTFDFEFTLLGRVTVRSAQVCAPFRQATLSRRIAPGNHTEFPLTKAEAESTAPERTFAIRHRLLEISLASSFVRSRLSLSWLSFSPPGV